MSPACRYAALLTATLALITRPALATWSPDSVTGAVAICTAVNEQYGSMMVPDGADGAIVVWTDFRTGGADVFAQRILPSGAVAWPPNGVGVCTAPFSQIFPAAAPDGAGGVFTAWSDQRAGGSGGDIYAQAIAADGTASWTADGVAVCTASGTQDIPVVIPDGVGGVIVVWRDGRAGAGAEDYWAQRLGPDGAPRWAPEGVQLTNALHGQTELRGETDGAGGGIFVWLTLVPIGGFPPQYVRQDFTAQAVDSNGTVRWGATGLPLLPSATVVHDGKVCDDGDGGAIISWRGNDGLIRAHRVDHDGAFLWNSGAPVLVYDGSRGLAGSVELVPDGSGGAFLAWAYSSSPHVNQAAQHLNDSGSPLWAANGADITLAAGGSGSSLRITPDGAGGLGCSWEDARTGVNYDIYAQCLDASGTRRWKLNGVLVCQATGMQVSSHLMPSFDQGWIVKWEDFRSGTTRDLYAQRVDAFGYLGDAGPTLTAIVDIANDQGGFASVRWSRSYLDRNVNRGVTQYRVLRETQSEANGSRGPVIQTSWEVVATVTANSSANYAATASTHGDDVNGVHPITTYRVVADASTSGTGLSWNSAEVGGWSIDNIAPPAPTGVHGSYDAGTASISWAASPAADFGVYRVYRGTEFHFIPGPGNFLGETASPHYEDPAGSPYYYRMTAVDVHANESVSAPFAAGPLAVGDEPDVELALSMPWPHPIRGPAMLRFATPRTGPVRIALFDAAGRQVAKLHDDSLPAGPHELRWNPGASDGGLASGLYLLRLEAGGRTIARRVVVTR